MCGARSLHGGIIRVLLRATVAEISLQRKGHQTQRGSHLFLFWFSTKPHIANLWVQDFHGSLARKLGFGLDWGALGAEIDECSNDGCPDHTATSIFVGRWKGVEFHNLEAPSDRMAWLQPTSEHMGFECVLSAQSSMFSLVHGFKAKLGKESPTFLSQPFTLPKVGILTTRTSLYDSISQQRDYPQAKVGIA